MKNISISRQQLEAVCFRLLREQGMPEGQAREKAKSNIDECVERGLFIQQGDELSGDFLDDISTKIPEIKVELN